MTRLFLYFFLLLSSPSVGQTKTLPDTVTKIKVSPTFWAIPGKTYVDSIEIDISKTYLDPDNIKEIKTYKGQDATIFSEAGGAILITRKKKLPFISLFDIGSQKAKEDSLLPKIFIIDKKLITDTLNVRLETSVIKSIEILKDSNKGVIHDTPKKNYLIRTKLLSGNKNDY